MRKFAKHLLWRLAALTGAYRLGLRRGAVVVGLHRVAASKKPGGLDCSPHLFERLCRFLSRNFSVCSLPRLAAKLASGRPVGGLAALTFDDGYLDNLTVAAPILKKYRLPATFFITSSFADGKTIPLWDRQTNDPRPMLSWDEVRQLRDLGFDIGAHSRTHADLAWLPPSALQDEIVGSRQDIRDMLGRAPVSFAYPFGRRRNITSEGLEVVRESGYTCCCGLYGGINNPGTSPYRVRRIPFSDWYLSEAHFGGDLLLDACRAARKTRAN